MNKESRIFMKQDAEFVILLYCTTVNIVLNVEGDMIFVELDF